MIVSKQFRFEASHILPKHPGKCSRLHGHSWVLTVSLEGRVNPETGFVRDYAEIKEIVERLVISRVDHQHLGSYNLVGEPGEVYYSAFEENFYPSSENLVLEFVNILQSEFGYLLYEVSLDETCTSRATWRRDG